MSRFGFFRFGFMTAVLKKSGNVPRSKLLLARFRKWSHQETKVCLATLVGTGCSTQKLFDVSKRASLTLFNSTELNWSRDIVTWLNSSTKNKLFRPLSVEVGINSLISSTLSLKNFWNLSTLILTDPQFLGTLCSVGTPSSRLKFANLTRRLMFLLTFLSKYIDFFRLKASLYFKIACWYANFFSLVGFFW